MRIGFVALKRLVIPESSVRNDSFINFLPWLLLSLLGSVACFWFKGDLLTNPGDFNFSFNPPSDLYRSYFFWDHMQSMGAFDPMATAKVFPYNILLTILYQLGCTLSTCQTILFFSLISFSAFSAYKLIRDFFPHNSDILPAFVGANFYAFNVYLMQYRIGSGYIMGYFFYATFPLLINFLLKIGQKSSVKSYLGFVFCIFLTLPSLNNPVYAAPLLVVPWFFLGRIKVFSYVKLLFFCLLCCAFYLYALKAVFFQSLNDVLQSSSVYDQLTISSSKASIMNLFRGLADWSFYDVGFGYFAYAATYLSALFIVGLFALPLLVISAFIIDTDKVRKKSMLPILLLYLTGIWLAKGIQPPLGEFYRNYLSLVRMPYEKFGILLVFALAILLSYALTVYKKFWQTPKKSFAAWSLIIIIINCLAYPMWTGSVWREETDKLPGLMFKLPNYFYTVKAFFDDQLLDYRILQLPGNKVPIPGLTSFEYAGKKYTGPDPLARILNKPIFYLEPFQYSAPGSFISKKMLWQEENNLQEFLTHLDQYAKLLNVRYIMLRNDAQRYYMNNKRTKAKAINNFLQTKSHITFDKIVLYKVPDQQFMPLIATAEQIIKSKGDVFKALQTALMQTNRWVLLPDVPEFAKLSTPLIEYRRINPTKIRVRLHGASDTVALVFIENFNLGWELRLGKPGVTTVKQTAFVSKLLHGTVQNNNLPTGNMFEAFRMPLLHAYAKHLKANGFANAWLININQISQAFPDLLVKNTDGSYDLELLIELKQQRFFVLALLLALTTLVIGFIVAYRRKKL